MKLTTSLIAAAAMAGALLGLSTAAQAAVVTETYDFSLSNFVNVGGATPSPLSSITGSFTLTFDPSLSYSNDTTHITINSLSDAHAGTVGFSASPGSPYYISVGGIFGGAGDIYGGYDDFVLQLEFPNTTSLGSPTLPLICAAGFTCNTTQLVTASGYTLASTQGAWLAATGSVTAVPEPATWMMLLLGVGGLGLALRARRPAVATA